MASDCRQHHALRLVGGEGAKDLGSAGVAVVGREGEPIPPQTRSPSSASSSTCSSVSSSEAARSDERCVPKAAERTAYS